MADDKFRDVPDRDFHEPEAKTVEPEDLIYDDVLGGNAARRLLYVKEGDSEGSDFDPEDYASASSSDDEPVASSSGEHSTEQLPDAPPFVFDIDDEQVSLGPHGESE